MGNPTFLYHKDHEPRCVDSDLEEEMIKEGWADSPAKAEKVEPRTKQVPVKQSKK